VSQYPIIYPPKRNQTINPSRIVSVETNVTANPAEDHFFWYYLQSYFGDQIHHNKQFLNYTPDFIYCDDTENLFIDIECDEPYVYDTGEPTHYIGSDKKRDRAFINQGWFVLRFAEQQIIETPEKCCRIIAQLIARYGSNASILGKFTNTKRMERIPFWTKQQAQQMARENKRDRYLPLLNKVAINTLSPNSIIQTLKGFINVETDSQIRETKQIWQKPLSDRVEDGYAISNLSIVEHTAKQITVSYSGENLSKFTEGDQLRLSLNKPFDQVNSYSCVLQEETGNHLVLRAAIKTSFDQLSSHRQDWVLDKDTVDVRDLLIKALNKVQQSRFNQDKILHILQGKTLPDVPNNGYHKAIKLIDELDVNFLEKQKEALAKAIATQNYYLIQGPPGTGKTWLLAHLATTLARQGQRVFITAFTHTAINNALRTIKQITGYHHVFKVGREDKTTGLSWEDGNVDNYSYFNQTPYSSDTKGLIVGATGFSLRTQRLQGIAFDTVIFDEAGQVTLPIAIAGMLVGERYIFMGDHKQLSPVITAHHQFSWVKKSIFETLFQHAPGTMLDITHRMNDEINQFPSNYFYDSQLQSSASARSRRLQLNQQPQRFPQLLSPDNPSVFLEMEHQGSQTRSREEAEVIAEMIEEAVNCGVSPEEIAVIAPYRAQVRLIRTALKNTNNAKLKPIHVDTVDSIQGQQREMVIISLTTSNPEYATQQAEFYFQLNRLNVAITRAKTKRIVVGNPSLFEANPIQEDLQAGVKCFYDFYQSNVIINNQAFAINIPQNIPQEITMKTIAIYHNKGGVGKTTTAVNLAATFAKRGNRVLLIDLDSQANTTYATGLVQFEDESNDDLKDSNILQVLESQEFNSIPEIARKGTYCEPPIDVIPSHISLMQAETELNNSDFVRLVLAKKLKAVQDQYDIVIIDTPPALNLYARIALIAADYLIIPSDLKPFANQGLTNVQNLIGKINDFREMINLSKLNVVGILPTKISTINTFIKYTFPKRINKVEDRYNFKVLNCAIFERSDLAKCSELVLENSEEAIPDPKSVLDYAPNSKSSQEFNQLVDEILELI